MAAFGVAGEPVPLAGGQGRSWLAGDSVLKPLDLGEPELEWQAQVLESISVDGFRISHPRRSVDGALAVDGWCAREWVAGMHDERRWPEIIAVGERFHAAVDGVSRPQFLASRSDPWATGDRVAWSELRTDEFAHVRHLPRLVAALLPIEARSQLIHGDLTGNVLFDDALKPAIIDFSPYWRPTAFASAIVVADALVWEGAEADVLDAVGNIVAFDQYLLRALIYRIVADAIFRGQEPGLPDTPDPYLAPVQFACQLAYSKAGH